MRRRLEKDFRGQFASAHPRRFSAPMTLPSNTQCFPQRKHSGSERAFGSTDSSKLCWSTALSRKVHWEAWPRRKYSRRSSQQITNAPSRRSRSRCSFWNCSRRLSMSRFWCESDLSPLSSSTAALLGASASCSSGRIIQRTFVFFFADEYNAHQLWRAAQKASRPSSEEPPARRPRAKSAADVAARSWSRSPPLPALLRGAALEGSAEPEAWACRSR
mmetsp:Transcript_68748/g.174670  ORF Transcript_68748/g.174670 Transcript_68748/m.174670 type:complete len:217 (-) Transcript_68748:135-785(-)